MHQKGFAHLLVILILGVGLVGGMYAYQKGYIEFNSNPNSEQSTNITPLETQTITHTPTTTTVDETKDWKTYTHANLRFSFKYPADWKLKSISDGKGVEITSSNTTYNQIGTLEQGAYVTFELWPYKLSGDISSLVETPGPKPESDVTIISSSQILLPAGQAVKTISKAPGGEYTLIQIPKGKEIYAISYQTIDTNLEATALKIIDTFRL